MINKKKKSNGFTQREIGDSCSNLVIRSLKPVSLVEIPEARLRKLRAYSQGLIAPLLKHLEQDILRPEEIVMILATGALYVQLKHVMRTDKMPSSQSVNEIYEGETFVSPEYLAAGEPGEDEILPRIGKPRKR